MIGETLLEALGCDLKSEQGAQLTLKNGIAAAELARDHVSRDLLRDPWILVALAAWLVVFLGHRF